MSDQHELQTDGDTEGGTFAVRCITCGLLMRNDRTEDSFGKCWRCFYRAINDYLQAQRGNSNPLFTSDR